MLENSKNDINLLIKKKGKNLWKKLFINYSFLSDYDNILKEISSTYYNKVTGKKDLKNIEIYLEHKKLNKIIVYNEEDWNFLYNNKIIKECISTNQKIKIDYKIINTKENNNEKIKQQNFKHILNYILENISMDFYFKIIFKFFNKHKEIKELFKLFFINELIKIDIEGIESKAKENNNVIIKGLDILNEKKINDNNKYYKYLMKTEDFFDIYKKNLEKNLSKIKNFNNIKNIINNINLKEKEGFYEINQETNYSKMKKNESIEFIINEILDKNEIHVSFNDKFQKLNYNKYISELARIKDNLNRFIYENQI